MITEGIPKEPPKPQVSEALVDHLDKQFPNRCPRIDDPERQIWAAVGARRVVDYLRRVSQEQRER